MVRGDIRFEILPGAHEQVWRSLPCILIYECMAVTGFFYLCQMMQIISIPPQKKGRNSTGISHCIRNTIFSITSYPG